MRVFVIGEGGREHALAWKLHQSPEVSELYIARGNAGTLKIAQNVNLTDICSLVNFAQYKNIDLTIVGSEQYLYQGIADIFNRVNKPILAPSREASRLEWDKIYAKQFMNKYNIPTAFSRTFNNIEEAQVYIDEVQKPLVIKSPGLCAGKGVFVCFGLDEAYNALFATKKLGEKILIENYLEGIEISFFVLTDGSSIVPLESCQDHKPIFEGDRGPNTGGMGAYSPYLFSPKLKSTIMRKIVQPTIEGLNKGGHPYKGILYFGLMIQDEEPFVLEYNARFGDPETQPLFMRLNTDFAYTAQKLVEGKLHEVKLDWRPESATCVVLTSKGYPGEYEKGKEIFGLEDIEETGAVVFHAGTKYYKRKLYTNGGRVLNVCALGSTLRESVDNTYTAVKKIYFENMHYRTDIGFKRL